MKKFTPLFWLQSTVLVMPIGFLLAGGCGGGGSSNRNPNGGFFGSPSVPVQITPTPSPSPTFDPNAVPTPTPTSAPTPTPTPISFTNFSPEFSFTARQVISSDTALRLFSSSTTSRTLSISVPRTRNSDPNLPPNFPGFNTLGQVFPAVTTALLARSDGPDPTVAGVTFVEGSKTWHSAAINGRSGTVVIATLVDGFVKAPKNPGFLTFELSEVTLIPDRSTDATGTLIITGPFNADTGLVDSGFFNFIPAPKKR